ncbi:MAG: M15 family metallopeptidase, partial [Spirochaetia bacterium]|nr:M15 family metallopeptidase [Spirochaetia bacterium]
MASVSVYPEKDAESIYGKISPEAYLSGKFTPSGQDLFIDAGKLGIPTNGRKQFLRKEAAEALKKMYQAFRKQNPDTPFWIQSSTRNFWDQKRIWESKWEGRTRVGGKKLNLSHKDPEKRAKKILEYSSMPGTSRHHWGSDLDFNKLYNSYFESGDGKILYGWLEKNAADYGFCQPYTDGRSGGYNEEKWHWSYRPLASKFLKDWNDIFSGRQVQGFHGWQAGGKFAGEYVNTIHSEC